MWAKIGVMIFALCIATVTAMPSKQDDENETLVNPDVCQPNPCGAYAVCIVKDNAGSCACLPEYFGDLYKGCLPECIINSNCPSKRACINSGGKDSCAGICGINAKCQIIIQNPVCSCSINYIGDPFDSCDPIEDTCLKNSDCSAGLACLREKCADPCVGTCGENAACEVLNHVPICSCPQGRTGDPFVKCTTSGKGEASPLTIFYPCCPSRCGPNSQCGSRDGYEVCSCLPTYLGPPPNCRPEATDTRPPSNPCSPSPCGPNCECQSIQGYASCTCLSDFSDRPPSCRRECVMNSDCLSTSVCLDQKCVDPCPETCGINANCTVLNHNPICTCPAGTTGNPFLACKAIETQPNIPEDKSEKTSRYN